MASRLVRRCRLWLRGVAVCSRDGARLPRAAGAAGSALTGEGSDQGTSHRRVAGGPGGDGEAGRVVWLADPRGGYPITVQKLKTNELILLVGPEGGFSTSEWKLLSDADVTPISLAEGVLRTETAAVAMVSAAITRLSV